MKFFLKLAPLVLAFLAATNSAQAQAQADPYAVCMYPEPSYAGTPLCIDYADIRKVRNIPVIASITIPRNTYVHLCNQPNFGGNCRLMVRHTPDVVDNFRPFEHASMILIPYTRAPQLGNERTAQVPAGISMPFNPDGGRSGRPDFEVFASEQGLAIRPINGAKMYMHMAQQPGLTKFHVMSCMAQHITEGSNSRYALVGQLQPGRRICIFTSQGRYALLNVLPETRPNYFRFTWALSGY